VKRRGTLVSLVGATAALSGMGWGGWRLQQTQQPTRQPDAAWWQTRFERPEGGYLTLAEFQGQPLLLNFWATWCPPCVHEMPLLDAFAGAQSPHGWRVVGLALDNLAAVQQFLKRVPVAFPVAVAGLEALDLSRSLGNHEGQLPFTVIWDHRAQLRGVKPGPLTEADLKAWAALE
jgi:thiol-disulfide isomerase/thioredoxin